MKCAAVHDSFAHFFAFLSRLATYIVPLLFDIQQKRVYLKTQ